MGNPLHLMISINLADGREFEDIEAEASSLSDVPRAVEAKLAEYRAEVYSSLMIVVVPKAAG